AIVSLLSVMFVVLMLLFSVTAATVSYSLSLHDALPISSDLVLLVSCATVAVTVVVGAFFSTVIVAPGMASATEFVALLTLMPLRSESTRLNSSHQIISYAVFCLKKKN